MAVKGRIVCPSILCIWVIIFFNSPTTHHFSFQQGLALCTTIPSHNQVTLDDLPKPNPNVTVSIISYWFCARAYEGNTVLWTTMSLFSGRIWVLSIPSFFPSITYRPLIYHMLTFTVMHLHLPPFNWFLFRRQTLQDSTESSKICLWCV